MALTQQSGPIASVVAIQADDLVVEEENFVRLDIASYLKDAGYAVIEAGSGEGAVALCNAGTAIDIIITDINLGGSVSGWDVAECFRTVLPNMPVLNTCGEAVRYSAGMPRALRRALALPSLRPLLFRGLTSVDKQR